jgi:basic membrane protein A
MKLRLTIILLLVLQLCFHTSCKKEEKKVFKIGLISGLGGFNDNSFNESALTGFTRARQDFPIITETRESYTLDEINSNIRYFGDNGYDLVITMGYNFGEAVLSASKTYPETDFLITDYLYTEIPSNVICATYSIDQASFPAGVLAAYWAWLKDPVKPVAGFVAGPDSAVMNPFSIAYINGIEYFNTQFSKNVGHTGYYATAYTDPEQGALLADDLIRNKSVDVIYPFAGGTGNGSLLKAKELGKWAIGVDVDQYYSLPGVKEILLTSCLKKIDNTVYDVISRYINNEFPGGSALNYTLLNDGVGLAPYHDYDSLVPDSIKTFIDKVIQDIKAGTLPTGVY